MSSRRSGSRRRAALPRLGVPGAQVALDLPRVGLEVLGVGRQPLLGAVATRLGVRSLPRPVRLGEAPNEVDGPGAHLIDLPQGEVEWQGGVVEALRPAVLVIALERRTLL